MDAHTLAVAKAPATKDPTKRLTAIRSNVFFTGKLLKFANTINLMLLYFVSSDLISKVYSNVLTA